MTAKTDPMDEIPAREKILRTTIDLVPSHGSDRITHRLVADAASVSPGTVTYHFDSIDTLVREAFRLYMDDYKAGLDAALEARPLMSADDVARFLVTLATTSPETSELARLEYAMVSHAQRDAALLDDVGKWARLLEQRIEEALTDMQAQTPRATANLLLTVCRGTEFDVMTRQVTIDRTTLHQRFLSLIGETG